MAQVAQGVDPSSRRVPPCRGGKGGGCIRTARASIRRTPSWRVPFGQSLSPGPGVAFGGQGRCRASRPPSGASSSRR
eukprot:5817181-Lingulodinium_polyedra.AAC.1